LARTIDGKTASSSSTRALSRRRCAIADLPRLIFAKKVNPMKSDVEKTIEARVIAAFDDILSESRSSVRREILRAAQDMVKAVWMNKIYAALPKDKTTIPEYFLDAELGQFLNEAMEECHARICALAERAKEVL
jgi:hypothetical protein